MSASAAAHDDVPRLDAGLVGGRPRAHALDVGTGVGVDGKPVNSAAALGGIIREHKPGDQVDIELRRNGDSVTVHVSLAEAPSS